MEEFTNESKKMNINLVIGVIGTVSLKAISLISLIIVGYLMNENEYGNLSTYNTWVTIISVFVGVQFSGSLQNALIDHKDDYSKYCNSLIAFSFVLTSVILLPFLFSINFFADIMKVDTILCYLLIPHCFGSFLVNFMSTYFLAQKKVKTNLIWTLTYSCFVTVLSLSFTSFFNYKEYGYSLGLLIPNALMGMLVMVYFAYKSKFKIDLRYIKYGLIFSLPLVMHTLSNIILGQTDKLMIRYILDEGKTAQYSMTHNYSMLLNSVWGAFNGIFLPYFYDHLSANDDHKTNLLCKNYYIVFSCISFAYILMGREIVRFIVNPIYYEGLEIFEIATLTQYFVFLYSFSVNYEFFHKKTAWIAIGTFSAAIINIGLNFVFISYYGIFGAALASLISYFLLVTFHELISRLVIKNYPVSLKIPLISLLVSLVVTVIAIFTSDFWYIKWILGVLIIVYFFFRIIKTKRII